MIRDVEALRPQQDRLYANTKCDSPEVFLLLVASAVRLTRACWAAIGGRARKDTLPLAAVVQWWDDRKSAPGERLTCEFLA